MIREKFKNEFPIILNEMTNMVNQRLEKPISVILLNLTHIFNEEKLDKKTVQRLDLIQKESIRIRKVLQKLKNISNPKLINYLKEIKIIDLNNSIDRYENVKEVI